MTEQWKEIPGFGGWYEVSDLGRVRSWRTNKPTKPRRREPIVLKPYESAEGYLSVMLHLPEQKGKNMLIHRLVMLTFSGPGPKSRPDVLHGDGNGKNNRLINLRWGNQSENELDKVSHGTKLIGEESHLAVLTEAQVKEIKLALKLGHSCAHLSRIYNVHYTTIERIKKNRTWTHIALDSED